MTFDYKKLHPYEPSSIEGECVCGLYKETHALWELNNLNDEEYTEEKLTGSEIAEAQRTVYKMGEASGRAEALKEQAHFRVLLEQFSRGIHRWGEMAVKQGWVKRGHFEGEDELYASIMSYAEGNDLKYPKV